MCSSLQRGFAQKMIKTALVGHLINYLKTPNKKLYETAINCADIQEDELKLEKKPNLTTWGTEPIGKEGFLHTEINGEIVKKMVPSLQGNYYNFFDGVYNSIIKDAIEPVTAQDGIHVMQIIEAAIQSSAQKKVVDL